MLKRKIYDDLLHWKQTHSHKCLMVKGARQVGKTYIIREFGRAEYASYVEINFLRNPELKTIFDGDLDAVTIFKRMSAQIQNLKLIPGDTLIFLDEIQNCGKARTAVKFLAEDGRYDVISSGSLLGLSYGEDGDKDVEQPESVPTGYEDFLTMDSLSFEEYLWAEGFGSEAIETLRSFFEKREEVPEGINRKYEELFREYMTVGGMPEAVAEYITDHDFNAAAKVQNRIIENYRMDISKHAKGAEKIKVRDCYDAVPRQLAKELKKFQYSTVEKGKTAKKYGGSIRWLIDSDLVNPSFNVCEANLPLMANCIPEQFKLYMNDTGLLTAMYGFETRCALLNNTLKGSAKGGIYENAIAACLVRNGYRLYYWKPDDGHELEFIIEKNGEVIPIEVKAGNTSTVSLNYFIRRYEPSSAWKLIRGNVGTDGVRHTIPHYMAMFL